MSWGRRMPSMRAVLEARQKAAAVQVEELEAELVRVRAALVDAEEVLRRRVIGLEQYLEALAEEDAPAVAVVSQRKPVGPRRAVPHRESAVGVEVLSVDYQALMAAAVEAGGDGLGARRAAVVLGWNSASRKGFHLFASLDVLFNKVNHGHRPYGTEPDGVNLNATGVELAEVSLWLNTMHPGMRAPWFGLHLRRGNSLIGGRRAVYAGE